MIPLARTRLLFPLRASLLQLALLYSSISAAPLELAGSPSGDLVLRLRLDVRRGLQVMASEIDGRLTHELVFPELPARLTTPGGIELPFAAHLIAAPPGAGVELEVLEARFEELEGILLPPVPPSAETGRPPDLVESEYLGILRGVDAYSLRLFPVSYDPGLQRLSVSTDLRVAVRFPGGGRFKPGADSPGPSPLYGAFLNPPAGMPPRAAAKRARLDESGDWYDPTLPWVKVKVSRDGVFRIDRRWLAARSVDAGEIDPLTLRLFHLGSEQPLQVFGQEDGSFDENDYLLFVGRFRRDRTPEEGGKDFESIYGRENFYWLTWGREAGRRFQPETAEPDAGYPIAQFHWTTAHFEEDQWFQVFADAPDIIRDHWFWRRRPIRGLDVDTPGSAVFTGKLPTPAVGEEYDARLRVALHGQTPAHHTVIKLNNHHVGDYRWKGQIEFEIDEEIPSTYLRKGTNRLLVQAFASATEGRDQTLFNYFAIDYRSRYVAWPGYLRFNHEPSTGTQFVVFDFSHPEIHLFDTAREIVFSGMLIDTTRAPLYTAIFEDENNTGAEYVIVDSASIRTPRGALDAPSGLRTAHPGADYLVISHEDFLDAAERLAGHRRDSGLSAEVVDVEDIFDEFSHGLMLREAVGAFISHAYHNWERPPQYVLLFGDATFDYRNILGGGHPSYVPTLYYDARRRGNSPSDYLFSLVDGDDLLPDVAVGRLAVETAVEAEGVVDKIVGYDTEPAPGDWRSRVVYLANHHPKNEFTRPSDELASRFSEPFGLQSVKIYNPDEEHLPNRTGKAFLDALNAGALLVNFNGHGAAGTMQYVFSLQFPDWDYLSKLDNGRRLPLVTAFSCLNGMFVNPHTEAIGEVFTDRADGGSIAYISASAQSFTSQNDLLGKQLFGQFFADGTLAFGPALNAAKAQVLAAHPSWTASALTMQLFGDPAQELALPRLPDYQPRELTTGGELLGGGIVPVTAVLVNNTRATRDSVAVLVAARGEATDDTLYYERQAPFVGSRRLSFDWRIGDRRGEHLLEVVLDPEDLVVELDEGNNAVAAPVDILSPVVPELLFPPAGAVIPVAAASFEAVVEGEGGQVEFQLSTAGDFASDSTTVSPAVEVEDGIAVFAPALPEGPWFWRARAVDGAVPGPWSATRSLWLSEEASVPGEQLRWRQTAVQMAGGGLESLELDGELLRVTRSSSPLRPGSATREDGFTVRGLKGAGVLVTDGTYLYVKRWFNDSSTIYPGIDFFTRIGTGLNGTVRARNYGVFGDSTTAGISATCHGDGYIYSESSRAFELERISLATGRLDTVAVPDGLLEWKSGKIEDGHSLITSDGEFIYNVAMSAESGMRTAWGVRVFDPTDGWRLLREFTSPPTETGFTFEWTDGILADGERLYFIEFGGQRRIRMVDALDGHFIGEWMSDQDTTRVITGQFDWVNNKAWLGDLRGPAVFRYSGTGIPVTGAARSGPIGPAERWHGMAVAASGAVAIDLQAAGEDGAWSTLPGFSGLTPGAVDLSGVDAARHPLLRLHATLSDSTREGAAASLDRWEVVWDPAPDLKAVAAAVEPDDSGFAADVTVRNLSAFAVTGAVVQLLAGGSAVADGARTLPVLERGAAGQVRIGLAGEPDDFPVVARVFIPGRPDAHPGDNTIRLPVEPKAPRFSARRWPAGEPFLHGDPLLPGQALFIRGPFVESGRILLAVDGAPQQPDSTFAASPDSGVRVLFRPDLPPGRHQLQLRLLSGDREIGSETLEIVLADELALANVLVHPHPVRERTAFTYVLSHEAEVKVELFSLSGRRVVRLGPRRQEAGFRQLEWDGRDADGGLVANGTYLYLIEAAAGNRRIRRRGPLVIVR